MKQDKSTLHIDKREPSFYRLRAARAFIKDALLIDLQTAEEVPGPDYASIDLGHQHVHHSIARFINHSCDPTAYVDAKAKKIVAVKPIKRGDEITFNYLISERQIVAPFDCNCGTSNCVRRVKKILAVEQSHDV